MQDHSPFVALLLITALAVTVPVVVNRLSFLRLPVVVGEIIAGMVIGRSGLHLVEVTPTLEFLQEFGFAFLMFLSGLEVKFGVLFAGNEQNGRPIWQRPVPLAVLSFTLTIALATAVGFGLTGFGLARNPLLMGLILSTTSLGIVVPVLKERSLTSSSYGQVLLVTALLSDFVTLLLLSFVIALLSRGLSLDLMLFMVLLAAFVAAARIGPVVRRLPALTRVVDELSHATAQIQVRGALALLVAWVVLAEALGVEVILGAFLAGAIVSISSQGHSTLPEKLDAIGYGFFIPLFFVMVGAEFDVSVLMDSPRALLLVPVLIAAAYMVKIVPALLFRTVFSWRETLAAGTLLSSRLSLIIAASAIALELGVVSAATNAALILVAIVTCTASPIIFGRILPATEAKEREGVIIFGTSQLASLVGERLGRRGEHVTFIGNDQRRLKLLKQDSMKTVPGTPSDRAVLDSAGAAQARALVVISQDAESVIDVCRQAQQHYSIPTIVARADDPEVARALQAMGVNVVLPPMATAMALEAALHFPAAFTMLMDQSDDIEVADVPITNPRIAGQSLRNVRLPGNALALGLRRFGDVVVPHGDTVLRDQDVVMLVGSPESLREARTWLGGSDSTPTTSTSDLSDSVRGAILLEPGDS